MDVVIHRGFWSQFPLKLGDYSICMANVAFDCTNVLLKRDHLCEEQWYPSTNASRLVKHAVSRGCIVSVCN